MKMSKEERSPFEIGALTAGATNVSHAINLSETAYAFGNSYKTKGAAG